jgi:DNA-binding transcriptional MerR regulator
MIATYGDRVADLLTTSELAKALGLSLRSVQRYIAAGNITPELTTPGGHHRWDLDNVREQLREQRRRSED